jgi:hypothetical protein
MEGGHAGRRAERGKLGSLVVGADPDIRGGDAGGLCGFGDAFHLFLSDWA